MGFSKIQARFGVEWIRWCSIKAGKDKRGRDKQGKGKGDLLWMDGEFGIEGL